MLANLIRWIRYGKTSQRFKSVDGGVVSEYEVLNRWGKPVGYFAYGSYDPDYSYPAVLTPTYEDELWLGRIWAHRRRMADEPNKYIHVPLWLSIKASICLLFGWWGMPDEIEYLDIIDLEVAWEPRGHLYYTDFGTGSAWEALAVKGWSLYTYENCSL